MEMEGKYVHKRRADNTVGQTERRREWVGCTGGLLRGDTGRFKIKSKLELRRLCYVVVGSMGVCQAKKYMGYLRSC